VAMRKIYLASVERDGRFWYIHIPQVGRSTQARHLREVELMARDLISTMDEIPLNSFEVELEIKLPEEVNDELRRAEELRQRAARSQSEAARLSRDAARHLHDQGLTYRDIGQVLGVSFQRVQQLVGESKELVDARPPGAGP
jgi:DNA-directed RNA polymerase specialized sigma24 family protein